MIYTTSYKSPVGNILLASKNNKLIGLWIRKFDTFEIEKSM